MKLPSDFNEPAVRELAHRFGTSDRGVVAVDRDRGRHSHEHLCWVRCRTFGAFSEPRFWPKWAATRWSDTGGEVAGMDR